ncbi:MAG: hypothetical protein RR326_06145, partial [Stenotrophomonas sp.]
MLNMIYLRLLNLQIKKIRSRHLPRRGQRAIAQVAAIGPARVRAAAQLVRQLDPTHRPIRKALA